MNNPRVVLVHHHIFKNAGTSFNYALKQSFGKKFFEYDLPNSQVVTTDNLAAFIDDNQSALAVSGHHIAMPPIENKQIKTISSVIIRDPISRVRSIYNFERKQDAQTDGAVMAKKLSFKAFVAWRLENSPHVFCDYQTLYCSRTGRTKERDVLTAANLELAMQNLHNCSAVGTVARYKEFLMMAQYESSRWFPDIVLRNAHLNLTSTTQADRKKESVRISLEKELGSDLVAKLKAMNKLDSQLYEFANNKLDEWLQKDKSKKAQYFESLGRTLVERKDWRSAKPIFQSALFIEGNSGFKTYYGLAECLEKTGDIDGAIAHYRQTIDKKPDFAWSYFRLGDIFYSQEAFSEALEYYTKAISVHPVEKSYFLYMSLGNTLAKLDKADAAAEAYLKADEINPASVTSKAKLSWIYFKSGLANQSNDYVHQALSAAADKCLAYVELGDIFSEDGNLRAASDFYKRGLELDAGNESCLEKLNESMDALTSD